MKRSNGFLGASLGGGAALALILVSSSAAMAAGTFSSYDGDWAGNGVITTDTGTKERIRCKAHYTTGGGGDTMTQNLTCASDSYKFNVVSDVKADGSKIEGDWEETSRGAKGHITGTISPSQISAYVNGLGFSARIGIAARAGGQSVTMSPTGTDITNVSVTMSKK